MPIFREDVYGAYSYSKTKCCWNNIKMFLLIQTLLLIIFC